MKVLVPISEKQTVLTNITLKVKQKYMTILLLLYILQEHFIYSFKLLHNHVQEEQER